MMNNIGNLLSGFRGFMQNPAQFLMQSKLNLPQNIDPMKNPNEAIQFLMNNGRLSQQQYNQLQQMAQQLQANPQFQQFFNNR